MTTGARHHHGRATLLALLLLVPLVHGAGAHLSDLAAHDFQIDAPAPEAGGHGVDEACALCVAGRGAIDTDRTPAWRAPIIVAEQPRARLDKALPAPTDRSRPDSPRAPPHARA